MGSRRRIIGLVIRRAGGFVAVLMALALVLGIFTVLPWSAGVREKMSAPVEAASTVTYVTVDSGGNSYGVTQRCLVRTSAGVLYLFYDQVEGPVFKVFYTSSVDNGDSWAVATVVDTASSSVYVDIDSVGTIHILYSQWSWNTSYVRYRQFSGGIMGAAETVASVLLATAGVYPGGMYVDSSNNVHVVYDYCTYGLYTIKYKERVSGAWSGATSIGVVSGTSMCIPRIGPYGAGGVDVLVGWSGGWGVDDTFYAKERVSGSWGSAKTVGARVDMDAQMFLGRDANIYFGGDALYMAYNAGGTWVSSALGAYPCKQLAVGASIYGSAVFADDLGPPNGFFGWNSGAVSSWGMSGGGTNAIGACNQDKNLDDTFYTAYSGFASGAYTLGIRVEVLSDPGTAPTVDTRLVTDITADAATLNGFLNYDGGSNCQYSFYYGQTSASGTPPTSWVQTLWQGSITSGTEFEAEVSGLSYGVYYGVKALCRNEDATASGGWVYCNIGVIDPIIYTQAASRVSVTTARLNAYVGYDGGQPDPPGAYVRFQYGTPQQAFCINDDSAEHVYGSNWAAQTFTVGADDYDAVAVGLKLYKAGSPGDLTIALYDTSGSPAMPDSELVSTTLAASTVTADTAGQWYVVTLSGTTLSGTGEYAVVLSCTGDGSNHFHWLKNQTTATYTGGTLAESTDSGSTWAAATGTQDGMFAVFSAYTDGAWVGRYITGDLPTADIPGLTPGTLYRFRAQIYNSHTGSGSPVDGEELWFVTATSIEDPTNLLAVAVSGSEVSLAWVKGLGSYSTMIRYQEGGYPETYVAGTQGYFSTSSSTVITGLRQGHTYYFRAWAFAPDAYWSTGYTQGVATTLAVGKAAGADAPPDNSYWFLNPSPAKIEGAPGYAILAWQSDTLGVPIGSWACMVSAVLVMLIGAVVLIVGRSALYALLTMCVISFAASMAGLTPMWIMFVMAVIGTAVIGIAPHQRTA